MKFLRWLGVADADGLNLVNLTLVALAIRLIVRPDVLFLIATLGLFAAHLAARYAATAAHEKQLVEFEGKLKATDARMQALESVLIGMKNANNIRAQLGIKGTGI